MAIEVVLETRIGRPIDEVFAISSTSIAGLSGSSRPASGASSEARRGRRSQASRCASSRPRRAGPATFDARVTRVDSPTHLSLSGKDGEGVSIDIGAQLIPVDDHLTVLRWEVRIGLPFRFRIFECLARPQVERAVALDLEAFKRRLESVAGD